MGTLTTHQVVGLGQAMRCLNHLFQSQRVISFQLYNVGIQSWCFSWLPGGNENFRSWRCDSEGRRNHQGGSSSCSLASWQLGCQCPIAEVWCHCLHVDVWSKGGYHERSSEHLGSYKICQANDSIFPQINSVTLAGADPIQWRSAILVWCLSPPLIRNYWSKYSQRTGSIPMICLISGHETRRWTTLAGKETSENVEIT